MLNHNADPLLKKPNMKQVIDTMVDRILQHPETFDIEQQAMIERNVRKSVEDEGYFDGYQEQEVAVLSLLTYVRALGIAEEVYVLREGIKSYES